MSKLNKLSKETSPYLLQHSQNPVDWHPWTEQSLKKARTMDKPILLSIGYSACHWCHIMAHESFEDEGIAGVMNKHFFNIKVDREERPDIDQIYQIAHQIITQRPGGWPLTMFLDPKNNQPFFGGTYFPNEPRHGMPGFSDLLIRISNYFINEKENIENQSKKLNEIYKKIQPTGLSKNEKISAEPVKLAREMIERNFDKDDYTDFSSEKHHHLAYKSVAESITLLKNNNDILPLKQEQSVLLIGPAANDLNILNGAWTHTWQGVDKKYNNDHPTILDQLNISFGNVTYFEGSKLLMKNGDEVDVVADDLKNATDVAGNYDLAIVCLGEIPSTERAGDIYTLDLPNEQKNIIKELSKKDIPIVLILVEGRPKIIRDIEPLCDAVIQTYLPGDHGAEALIDILLGNINPSGKLPYTYPKYNGVIMNYDYKQSETINGNNWKNDFYEAQWDFGFGLSYTNFEYSNLSVDKEVISSTDELIVSVDIENTGKFKGKEVIQLYLHDHYATISPPLKKLIRYCKIDLNPNEKRTVSFKLNKKDLEFFGVENCWIVEEGSFSLFVDSQKVDFIYKN